MQRVIVGVPGGELRAGESARVRVGGTDRARVWPGPVRGPGSGEGDLGHVGDDLSERATLAVTRPLSGGTQSIDAVSIDARGTASGSASPAATIFLATPPKKARALQTSEALVSGRLRVTFATP